MGYRFRKRIRLAKGIYWNLGKKGSSLSIGRRGAAMNVSKKGVRDTFSLTGNRDQLSNKASWNERVSSAALGVARCLRDFRRYASASLRPKADQPWR
jgi:hypothetical protein